MVRRNKFNARKTVVDGITFASAKEAKRYGELKLLEKAGAVRNLEIQPKFPIAINGIHCFNYIADFAYFDGEKRVIEDAKGVKTPIYRLKAKCVRAMYGIEIREI